MKSFLQDDGVKRILPQTHYSSQVRCCQRVFHMKVIIATKRVKRNPRLSNWRPIAMARQIEDGHNIA
jgi:hypothetical protein